MRNDPPVAACQRIRAPPRGWSRLKWLRLALHASTNKTAALEKRQFLPLGL
jgi:hypothetical protein